MRIEKVGSTPIRVGRFLDLDDEGFVINDACQTKIPSHWGVPISDLIEAYLEHFGTHLHSVYIRGSLVRGDVIDGVSDIDSIAIVTTPRRSDHSWMSGLRKYLKIRYPFVADVECRVIRRDDFLYAPCCLPDRFMVKTQSICVWGTDLVGQLPRYRPDKSIIHALHGNLGEIIETTCAVFQNRERPDNGIPITSGVFAQLEKKGMLRPSSPEEVRTWCLWVMRRIIRAGFAVVMGSEGKYTRDLYLCYECFAKHYPEQEPKMKKALELAIQPSDDPVVIIAVLNELGVWLAPRLP